jgi:hypothetical protein
VDNYPQIAIVQTLDSVFNRSVTERAGRSTEVFNNYFGLIESKPQFMKDSSGLPLMDVAV